MDTIELHIKLSPVNPWGDILIAQLADLGFDSFVNTDDGIMAYGSAELNVDEIIKQTCLSENPEGLSFDTSFKVIEHQNWNATWEENFDPVYVEAYASILAPFHDKTSATGMIAEIQPQMSFGTGHHQTTWMMTKAIFELEKMPDRVLDMGTGTGVLAIFAEKLGADRILAIDIEDWSAENAAENAVRNQCTKIESVCGDIDKVGEEKFGLIIANINKNVLKAHMESYARALEDNGTLLLSGFFNTDVKELVDYANSFNLSFVKTFNKDEWAAIQLIKK